MSDSRSPKTPARTFSSSGQTKTSIYVDQDTLQQMINTFGPLEFSEFSASRQGDPPVEETSATKKQESLMEWFDRSVEKELDKRRDPSKSPATMAADPALSPLKTKHALNLSKGATERLAQTSASRTEITTNLRTDFRTELTDAAEKLAEAEMMCSYAEALQAAEEAAQNAPPELMEEAARAGAQTIEAKFTKVKNIVPGIKPIEVVGYVGVTKPSVPKKN